MAKSKGRPKSASTVRREPSAVQSWDHFPKAVGAGRNAIVSPLIYEVLNVLRSRVKPSAEILAACGESYYSNARIAVNDLEFVNMALPAARAAGTNCRFIRSIQPGKPRLISSPTFNNGWLGSPKNANPAPFYSPSGVYHVPMIRWADTFVVYNYGGVTTIQLPVRYQRYVAIMFRGKRLNPDSVKAAALEVAAHDRLQNGFERHFVRGTLTIPRFTLADQTTICALRCNTQSPVNATIGPRLEIATGGIGVPLLVPKYLPLYLPLPNFAIPPLTLTFDHPFYFAIVDRLTHTILFIGYVARPRLNM